MDTEKIINKDVALTVSDPWEFGTLCGTGPFYGRIVDTDSSKILIKLNKVIEYRGKHFTMAIGTPRFTGEHSDDILNDEALSVNILLVSSTSQNLLAVYKDAAIDCEAVIGAVEIEKRG